jgi:NAD(P)-dependent dehydrogenase (short-subunit alcohol dehydrogenase family)
MTELRQIAVVTGAADGIGRATAERLSANGWSVVASDINGNRLNQWATGMPNIVTAVADVSRAEENEKLVELAVSEFGGLDSMILNAGVAYAGSIESAPLDQFEQIVAVNMFGVVHGVRAALPELRKAANPSIVVTASTNGLGGDHSMSYYTASKFGAVGLVKAMAREIGFEGIRINAVCPGATWTGMTRPVGAEEPEVAKSVAAEIPLGRWAEPHEIAAAIEFLASPAASFITGVALPVDGGANTGVGMQSPARSAADVRTVTFADSDELTETATH